MKEFMKQGNEICVPAESLAANDENDEMVTPASGDSVSLQIEGKVVRSEGGMVYVVPETVNGEPMTMAQDKQEDSMSGEDDFASMERDFGGENY